VNLKFTEDPILLLILKVISTIKQASPEAKPATQLGSGIL
jgi:hypothetical protein